MKILLTAINSKYIHSNLAVFSLKAYHDQIHRGRDDELKETTQQESVVEIAEYTINQYTDDILASIYEKKPDVVAFSCYIWNIVQVYEVAAELKKVLPAADIWLGGPEVTYDSEKVLRKHTFIDGVMLGEGEETFREVCSLYEKHTISDGKSFDQVCTDIRGITFRKKETGEIIQTALRPLMNMDELPFVYQDMEPFRHKIIYYESSRGCPYGCSYCLSSVEKCVRFRSLSLVLPELQRFMDMGVAQVKFVDRTFNCHHDRTMEILTYIKEHDNGFTNFHFEIAADLLKPDEIEIISKLRPGLIQLEIGVQSSNKKTIHEIDRVMDLSVLSEVVENINKQENVHQHLDLIAGLPFEDKESFRQSFDYVYGLKPEQLQLGFLKVLKGSKMEKKAGEYGIVYQDKPPYEVLYTKWITYDEILDLKNIESLVENYYNSRQYVNTIQFLTILSGSAFSFFEGFAEYYKANALYEVKHTRISRYEILYKYLQRLLKDEPLAAAQAVELLIADIYLRENVKTRPFFAEPERDTPDVKKKMKQLYQACDAPRTAHLERFSQTTVNRLKQVQNIKKIEIHTDEKELADQTFQTNYGENGKIWLLFDYEQRDTLNYNAQVLELSMV